MPYFLDYWETIPASTLADDPISFNALSSRDGAGNTINTLASVTGATALDLAQGNVQHISSTSGNYTLGTPSGGLTGKDRTFMLVIDTTTTGHTPTFFGSLTWSTGAEPTITWTGSTRQMFQFWTVDGTNWLGWHLTGPASVPVAQPVNAQTGTTYTLVASDAGKLVTLSNASAVTLTVPQDSAATISIGTYVDLYALGAGQVTVVAGSGATLRTSGLTAKSRAQYARFAVQKVSANTWSLFGDLAAS